MSKSNEFGYIGSVPTQANNSNTGIFTTEEQFDLLSNDKWVNFVSKGGTESTANIGGQDYKIHAFTSSGTFETTQQLTVDYLMVAGGGGGSGADDVNGGGGGGGAGGLIYNASQSLNAGTYTITIGAGGAGAAENAAAGASGNDTTAFSKTALGGGGGGRGSSQDGG